MCGGKKGPSKTDRLAESEEKEKQLNEEESGDRDKLHDEESIVE